MNKKSISIVWWWIGWLATAILMAKDGHEVSVYEKNECLGGRASIFSANGYTFDMGPSWYLMPDLFEKFFKEIGEDIHEHLDLAQLSPSYKVFYPGEITEGSKKQQEVSGGNKEYKEGTGVRIHRFSPERQSKLSQYEHTPDGYLYSARAHIVNQEWKTMALYDTRRDAYTVPGGKVDIWESIEQSLVREVEEEIGVKVIQANLIGQMKTIWSGGLVCHIHFEVTIEWEPIICEPEKFSRIVWVEQSDGIILIDGENIQNNYQWNRWRRYCYDFCETQDRKLIERLDENTPISFPEYNAIQDDVIYISLYDIASQSIVIIHEQDTSKYTNPYIFLWQTGTELKQWLKKVFMSEDKSSKSETYQLASMNVYADIERMANIFEKMEQGSGQKFRDFLKRSGEQYHIGMEFALKNYDSIFDFFRWDIALKGMKLNIWTTIDKYVARFFKTPIIQKIMQYTTVFLWTAPSSTPAFYNIMSHVDFAMGVRYPQGGLHAIATALVKIGKKYGVQYYTDSEVVSVKSEGWTVKSMTLQSWKTITSDLFVVNADQARFETEMLPLDQQTYTKPYREKKTFAPSGFIIYAGVNKKLEKLEHHNLYFNDNRAESFGDIYERHVLPGDPSIYLCAPSKTDPNVAPSGKENLFILVPIPNGITISEEEKKLYRDKVWKIVEDMAGEETLPSLEYEQIFEVQDFKDRYNAWNGTALGLGHTMMQTACFRPNNYSKKLSNLFYVGHNTNPGIGVPMVIISAMLVKERIYRNINH